jgi:hypothetical protein
MNTLAGSMARAEVQALSIALRFDPMQSSGTVAGGRVLGEQLRDEIGCRSKSTRNRSAGLAVGYVFVLRQFLAPR